MNIGIIGAENSHARHFGRLINVENKAPGFKVTHLWGETEEFAKKTAEHAQIPEIVEKPREMLGKIDGLFVDHRHAKYHLAPALPFVKKGVPTFIDKPFCYRAEKGREFLEIARENGAPVTSFSIMPYQNSAKRFFKNVSKVGELQFGVVYGPCDINSPHGGVFFYGIHQLLLAMEAFGDDIEKVRLHKAKPNASAQLYYADGPIVTLNFITEGKPHKYHMTAVGMEGTLHKEITRDESPHANALKAMTKFYKTGEEPIPHEMLLKPIRVLEALQKSLKSGQIENVEI